MDRQECSFLIMMKDCLWKWRFKAAGKTASECGRSAAARLQRVAAAEELTGDLQETKLHLHKGEKPPPTKHVLVFFCKVFNIHARRHVYSESFTE